MTGLTLDGLVIGYDRALLPPIDLHIDAGGITAVLGASGSGKSTLLQTIAGVVPALDGRVRVDDRDITALPIQARGVGLMFQEPLLFSHLDVVDNIAYGLRRRGLPRGQARAAASDLLTWVGLAGYEHRPVRELSGGQAQRVALARALAPEPRVMLLDEPFSALDVDLRRRLAEEVPALLRERGCAVCYVTHDPIEAEAIAQEVIRL